MVVVLGGSLSALSAPGSPSLNLGLRVGNSTISQSGGDPPPPAVSLLPHIVSPALF